MISGGLINMSGAGNSGGGGPFAFFAHAEAYNGQGGNLPNGGGSVTLHYASPAGGLALVLVDLEAEADSPNAFSYNWNVLVDGAGPNIAPSSNNQTQFMMPNAGNGNNLSTFPCAMHKSFVCTLPAGAHTLVFNIAASFGSGGYFLGAGIKAFYN